MKNLSAIPRLSLTETFTILITLVVCLAGFTEAEVHTNYRKQDCNEQEENYRIREASLKRNVPYAHQMSKMTENELEDTNIANFKNILDVLPDRLIKRHLDDFSESAESDEKESDGYGYDDDEYYHFNYKRNDENLENTKLEKEGVHDSNEKEGVSGQKLLNQIPKEKTKEIETIEMLNYKETHPNLDENGNPTSVENKKSLSEELNRKKAPSSSNILGSLKMSDLRETSAIDEKMKDSKDESSLAAGSSETKTSDAKKSIKVTEDKDAIKLKDSKLTENAEQKEKAASLKDAKEAVVGKSIKENTKSTEEKEKGVKLSDSSKFEDNVDNISGKTNENDSPKISKEDTDIAGYSDKVSSDVINPNILNELNNRVNFVSNDYKDSLDTIKVAGVEEDEKPSEESCGMESNAGLSEYQDDLRSSEKLRKYYNQRDVTGSQNYGALSTRENNPQMFREAQKVKDYPQVKFDVQNLNDNDLLKKDWKEVGLEALKFLTQQPVRQQQMPTQDQQRYIQVQHQISPEEQVAQHKVDINYDPRFKNTFELNFPQSDFENSEYHKNYLKSLKRYKSLNADQKGIFSDMLNSGASRSNLHDESKNVKKKVQESVKRRSMETPAEEKENTPSQYTKLRRNTYKADSVLYPKNSETTQSLSKSSKDDTKLTEVKKQEELHESNRARRKSQPKLEYEIKVINQSPQDSKNSELSHITQRRFEKDLKTKLATDEKYLKKYPYSQVSRDDLMRAGESPTIVGPLEGERKFKRKAPMWKGCDKKSIIQTRAVPSGYYSNRVKFGQKNFVKNNERDNSDPSSVDTAHVSSSYLTSDFPSMEKNKLQRSWEVKQQDYKHDPMKRYDESGYMNKGNSLLLVRKGSRTATTFEEGSRPSSDSNLNPDNLAKMLSKDNDYIVLKKTDSNKFQKISDTNPSNAIHTDTGGVNYSKFIQDGGQRESISSNVKQALKNKGLYVRSFHPDKEDKKFSSTSHSSMSNLKKTFDKFRDLAGFFKDNEQESTDNQYSAQELKEGRDIVFSEDKLPDPIVISSDANGKNMGLNQKQQNSIYSISTNFKTLDQQDKKNEMPTNTESDKNMFTAEAKNDNSDSSWEPTLKNIFPEAKSINSMSKNGNEIIILDLNRNQLKTTNFQNSMKMTPKSQYGAFGLTSQVPNSNPFPSDNTIQLMLSPNPSKLQSVAKVPQKNPYSNKARNNGAYAVVRTADNVNQLSIRDIADLPSLLRALTEKKSNTKLLTKRSPPRNEESQLSENYKKFLTDFNELSELNKSGYRKGKFAKRTADEIMLPSGSFNELSTYGDANIKYLLNNIVTGENPEFSAGLAESSDGGISKSLEESLKSNQIYLNSEMLEPDHTSNYHRRWSTIEAKSMNNIPLQGDKAENDHLRSEMGTSEDNNFQSDLLSELAAASDKISKLQREGAGMRELRRTIEESLPFTGKHEPVAAKASPQKRSEEKCCKIDSESVGMRANDKMPFGYEHDIKESSDKSSMKADYENHLNQFFENLNSNKNQKNQLNIPNENTWKRKKRKENHRRKRSASRDVKNKVSTTAVQNTILKNLAEDNYQSIYSPGIKRRLFSTNNEAGDAENFSDGYERDKNVIAVEAQPKCVKNSLNKCIDPIIVELFGDFDKEEEKNRARRSLTSGFHSNFKREIDLDESMPNDFQNFLVTSLGGFGSQNREVIKKDVALWERKENTQDSNQVVDSSVPVCKDDPNSTLEKREVPSNENRKSQTYFPSGANSNSNVGDLMATLNNPEKKLRSDAKSKLKSQAEFADEKLPTQIRIQITNASSKEKKSSKPIMEESDTTSTEMENLPKKEFFDKNKISPLRLNNHPKIHNLAKNKFSFSDYEDPENTENSNPQTSYRLHRRRRKKKKYIPENPVKPIKDFIKFDQKTMETLLKSIMANQNMATSDKGIQKTSINNPSHILPQVETVYNPTQGTNKAQLEVTRLGRINSANNKNMGTAKNSIQSTDSIGYDDLGNFLKDKTDKIKLEKLKEFEDIDWKPRYGKMRLRQEFGWEPSNNNYNLESMKTPVGDSNSFSYNLDTLPYANPFSQHLYNQKNLASSNNYFYHPSATSSNTLYDALKLKQEIKNQNALTPKGYKKPFYYGSNGGLYKMADKERNQNALFSGLNAADSAVWNYDYSMSKKPNNWGFKSRDFLGSTSKNQNQLDSKSKIAHGGTRKFVKSMDDDKSSVLNIYQSLPQLENTKDTDYLDNLGAEDYIDDDTGKELRTEELVLPSKYHRLFNSDTDDNMNMNEDEEEADEDYDENSEEEYPEDYSLLANTKAIDSELTKHSHRKFQNSFNEDNALPQVNYVYPKEDFLGLRGHSIQQTKFTNSKNDVKFSHGHQHIPLIDMKTEVSSLSGSTGLLKKANEHSNIFEKNLMKNTYDYNPDNPMPDQFPENKMKELSSFYHHNKIFKRKMDSQGKLMRNRQFPQIGSRLFYASKTEVTDNDQAPLFLQKQMPRKTRNSKHISCSRNSLNAEFADTDNNLDNESEVNENENLINFGKNLQEDVKKDKVTDRDENTYLEDVAENLEDDGETISEDNVLENVIGKYIMRKRVVSSGDLNKPESLQTEGNHKLGKRSLWKQKCEKTRDAKIVKRLSSGHLTENNFRKYHKKNLTRKRDVKEFDSATHANLGSIKSTLTKTRQTENTVQRKRSALDLFKKIRNKDRDNKKVENVDGRTAGFEPLSSLNDKKYESSVRDGKFEFLNQARKLSNECSQTQSKSNLLEFKPHNSNEDQFSADQRKKDKMKLMVKENVGTTGQGPWKIELNDRSDLDLVKLPESLESLKEVKRLPASQNNEHLKAFLVFRNNLGAFKRSTAEDLPPTSGSSQIEVGNSYGPKSDEGRRISKMHVRKRSLDSSLVTANDKAAAQTSTDHFTSGKIKETLVNVEEKNRALQDAKSFSEGDSESQPPHVLQRNTKNISTSVSDAELGTNARFPPEGSSINRKSVFPPSDDTNIMRDSRQVNEETSKYLGQQIVDAILSHVSTNTKLKELIAPGLAAKTTAYREDIDIRNRPLQQADISEQLQFFLQRFMLDLERLAESHLKKRMCTQIDDQSKEFLQSLLNISGSSQNTGSEKCQVSEDYLEPENFEDESTTSTTTDTSKQEPLTVPSLITNSAGELDNLNKKHCLLLKLIDDYEKLTKLEKDSLSGHYQYLLDELQQTNKEMRSISPATSNPYEMMCSKFSNDRSRNEAFENILAGESFNTCRQSQNCTSFPQSKYPSQRWHCGNQPPQKPNALESSVQIEPPKPVQVLPTFSFEEDAVQNKAQLKVSTSRPFEKVDPTHMTNSSGQNNMNYQVLNLNDADSLLHSSPAPQTFDLLPIQNTTQKFDYTSFDQPPGSSDSIRFRQSLSGTDNFESFKNPVEFQNPKRLTELNKLSLGDAAGLQLSLKYRGPWVSNLDVAKTIRNVPLPLAERSKPVDFSKPELEEGMLTPKADNAVFDAPSVTDVKNSGSFLAPSNEYSGYGGPSKTRSSYTLTVMPNFSLGMIIPKNRPFESVNRKVGWVGSNGFKVSEAPANYYLNKISNNGKKRVFLRSKDLLDNEEKSAQIPVCLFQPRNSIKKYQNLFTHSSHDLMKTSDFMNQYPKSQSYSPNDNLVIMPLQRSSEAPKQNPKVIIQPLNFQMQSTDVPIQSADVMTRSENYMIQPQNVQTQSSEVFMQSPEILTHPQNVKAQCSDVLKQTDNAITHSNENLMQPLNFRKQTSDVSKQSPDVLTLTYEPLIQPKNFQILSSDNSMQPLDVLKFPDNPMLQPLNFQNQQSSHNSMLSRDILTLSDNPTIQPQSIQKQQSSDVSMQSPDVLTLSDNPMKQPHSIQNQQSSDIFMQSPDILTLSNNAMTQPLSIQKQQSSDTSVQSPDVLTLSDNPIVQPLSIQKQQTSDDSMQSPNVLTLSDNPMIQPQRIQKQKSSDVSVQSPDIFTSSKNLRIPTLNVQPPPCDVSMQPSQRISQPPNEIPQLPNPRTPQPEEVPQMNPFVWITPSSTTTTSPFEFFNYPDQHNPNTDFFFKKKGHKKNRLFAHFPLPHQKKHKHKNRNKSKKSLSTRNSDKSDDEDSGRDADVEYLAWSTMPAVRRQLNKLESGQELDDFFNKNLKLKKMFREGN